MSRIVKTSTGRTFHATDSTSEFGTFGADGIVTLCGKRAVPGYIPADAEVTCVACLRKLALANPTDALTKPSTTEDGAVDHPTSAEDIAEAKAAEAIEATNPDNAGERIALGSLIAELAGSDYVTTDEAAAVVAWVREWVADCDWADEWASTGKALDMPDADLLRCADRHISYGLRFVLDDVRRVSAVEMSAAPITTRDAVAASLAKRAAEGFTFNDDDEDAESAAGRAADILRDLSPGDVPTFVLRVFGLPLADRYVSADVEAHRRYIANDPGRAFPDDWQSRVQAARTEKGYPDVARVLVLDHADIVARVMFMGDAFGSTNQAQWDEGIRCLAALNSLRAFTYGSGPLDSVAASRSIEDNERDAIGHAIEAVQYAADNARQGDSD